MSDPSPRIDDSPAAQARHWVARLASGEMDGEEMARFRAWLAAAEPHREAFDEARVLWQRAEAIEDAFQIRARPRQGRAGLRATAVGGLLAASLTLAVGFDDLHLALMSDYMTPVGGKLTVALADGSTAHLNTDSAIAVEFSTSERRIKLLRGEAYFEVAHDRARPFRVIAQDGATRAVGTAFDVRDDGRRVTVAVGEGTVAVTSPEQAGAPTTATLQASAGERVAYRQGEAPQALAPITTADAAPWRDGRIVLEGVPFADAIAELDRYRPGRVLLLGDASRYRPVSGVFAIDQLDQALTGLAATQGLKATRLTPYLLVLR